MSTLLTLELDDLRPRRYQEEVFEQAKEGNIIAALGTGSGKTYISTLLIKWISSQPESKGKAIVFVVPMVALVEQQSDFIARHSTLRVLKVHGGLGDMIENEDWKERLEAHDVFVMTAQLFLNFLTHSLWSADKVSLAVIDECHHTRKNHPYNGIMREFLRLPFSARPKIFGMTASPIWNTKNPAGSLEVLERNLDAKVIGVRDHADELAEHMPKPVEVIRHYAPPLEDYVYPSPSLWECLNVFDPETFDSLDITWLEIERRYSIAYYSLGPHCANLFLFSELRSRMHATINGVAYDAPYGDIEPGEISSPDSLPPDLLHVQDVISDFEGFYSDETSSFPVSLGWCTPKVQTLVDILKDHVTPTFQGIIFVEQRHIAICLAIVLANIPQLKGLVRCRYLLGVNRNEHISMAGPKSSEVVKMFRSKEINLLVATSVAEEGLDFPACDVIIRFDPLQHLVGYIQSRGRARAKAAKFVVMVQKNDTAYLARYQKYMDAEPELKSIYDSRANASKDKNAEDDDEDRVHPEDLASRERYMVPSTGAFVSYDNALNLINQLCSMIPCDKYTKTHLPRYTGEFQATMFLPASLPLPPQQLIFLGKPKHSKREARRAVAFKAVRMLHALQVYDDYLLPVGARKKTREDADGHDIRDTRNVPNMLQVDVRDPWCTGSTLWCHALCIDGKPIGGIVTGTRLPSISLGRGSTTNRKEPVVSTLDPQLVEFSSDEAEQRFLMHAYTRFGVWYKNTSSPFDDPLSFYLVPITHRHQPDFDATEGLVDTPYGSKDWSQVDESYYGRIMVVNKYQFGRSLLLHRIRHDLTPLSKPPPGSREYGSTSYKEYLVERWTRKRMRAVIPDHGPMLEVSAVVRSVTDRYDLDGSYAGASFQKQEVYLVPQNCCRWVSMSDDVQRAYEVLPAISRRITDVWRAREAQARLGLGGIDDNLMVQALTIPGTTFPFNNQRLETLGDAVIEVCTTVHLLNKFPYRHEGQLDLSRQVSISNRFFMARALDVGLETLITSEGTSLRTWRYVVPKDSVESAERTIRRTYPRRSLQDCIEAILGASFVTGGIQMALRTGTALDLTFGGPLPWCHRYERRPKSERISPLFSDLQVALGYTFRNNELLLEAITHPSFAASAETPSYQRLEFLGDAVLDLVVIKYLYDKFPEATSELLARPRAKAVCAPCLASLAVRKLRLHRVMLINNVELSMAIDQHVHTLEALSAEDIVKYGWKYDPPKAISDVFESVVAAVLVDSDYDYERTACVVEHVMDDVLAALSPSVKRDPISELTEWVQKFGCKKKLVFSKETGRNGREGIVLRAHDIAVTRPIISTSTSVARELAAERGISLLCDPESELSFARLCTCGKSIFEMATTCEQDGDQTPEDNGVIDNLGEDVELNEMLEVMNIVAGPKS